jgi:hypothetical protein
MLLFIEREQFLKLFKFGEIKIPATRFVDGYDPASGKSDIPIEILDSRLPLFEQDHEVLILEIPKDVIILGVEISVKISHVRKIYPLTEEADRFLTGRMNPSIIFQLPIFEKLVNELKIHRDFRYRLKAWEALAVIFQVDREFVNDYTQEITDGLKNRLGYSNSAKRRNYLFSLICFNRNPVYPQGYIEYLFKAASVFVEMKNGSENDFERGPLYKFLENKSFDFKGLLLNECILRFKSSLESKPLIDELSKQYPKIDILIVGTWFLYLKDKLNKNSYNLSLIKDDIHNLKSKFPKETAVLLYMIGMLFGFDNLYASLYELNSIPIYNKNPGLGISEQNKDLKRKIQEERIKSDQLKFDYDRSLKLIEDMEVQINQTQKAIINSQEKLKLLINLIEEKEPTLLQKLKLENHAILGNIFDLKTVTPNSGKKIVSNEENDIKSTFDEPRATAPEIKQSDSELQDTPVEKTEDSESENYSSERFNIDDQVIKESEDISPAISPQKPLTDPEEKPIDMPSLNQFEQKAEDQNDDFENSKLKKDEITLDLSKDTNGEVKEIKKSKSKTGKSITKTAESPNKKVSKLKKADNLFNQQVEMRLDDSRYYHDELLFIIQTAKEKGLFEKTSDQQTFEEAIMGYSPNGGFQHALLNEVEELQKDLKLSDGIVDQLRTIIMDVKK